MTPRCRILVVDASVVGRQLLARAVVDLDGVEMLGTYHPGPRASARIREVSPDVVVVGAGTDGSSIEVTRELRAEFADLGLVCVVESMTTEARRAAVVAGATVVASMSPVDPADLERRLHLIRESVERELASLAPDGRNRSRRALSRARVDLVTVGLSTGGPDALRSLWHQLPADLGVPIVIAQHMPSTFTPLLAQQLASIGTLGCAEASDGAPLRRGTAVLAPGDRHLRIESTGETLVTRVFDGPRVNGCRPSVDLLFSSAAEATRGGLLGVVLTGMGTDGLEGSRAVVRAGGQVIVQDETTAVVWGMPGAVAAAGLARAVVPLDEIVRSMVELIGPLRGSAPAMPAADRTGAM